MVLLAVFVPTRYIVQAHEYVRENVPVGVNEFG